jgi:hypothetical protein
MRSGSAASASRSRTRGWRTATGPIPVIATVLLLELARDERKRYL